MERLGELADALERAGLDDALVVVEVLVEQRDTFEHGRVFLGDGRTGGLERSIYCTWSAPSRVPTSSAERCRPTRPRPRSRPGSSAAGFDDVVELPLADGGEGTLDALLAARGGSRRTARVTGPLGDPVDAEWGVLPGGDRGHRDGAARAGSRSSAADNDPLRATTRGTGELIAVARREGFKRGRSSRSAGARRPTAASARSTRSAGRLQGIEVTVACDVDDRVPRRGARSTGRRRARRARRSRCSTRRLDAARRAVPRRAPASTSRRSKAAARPAASRAGSPRSARGSCPASTSSPRRSGSKPRSTARCSSSPAKGKLDATSLEGKVVGGVLDWARRARRPERRASIARPGHRRRARRRSRTSPVSQVLALTDRVWQPSEAFDARRAARRGSGGRSRARARSVSEAARYAGHA